MDIKPSAEEHPPLLKMAGDPLIVTQNLRKVYDENVVLKSVSVEIPRGVLVSIIGPSGCGKSTFLRCLNGLEELDSGSIQICGLELEAYDTEPYGAPRFTRFAHEVRQKVGMVFQQFNLFPNKTILDNCILSPMIVKGEAREEVRDRAVEYLRRVGLSETLFQRYPSQLSGGQQQRAAIARALTMRPQVILYDEPTSALDPEAVDEVQAIMRQLDAEMDVTQLVVTHEMRFAKDASDYIIFMEGGYIVEIGRESELFVNPQRPETQRFLKRYL